MNKKIISEALLVAFGLSVMMPTGAFAATDTQGHWAADVLDKWESQSLINGYDDGSIRPNNEISRAEYVALVNRVAKYSDAVDADAVSFSDVKSTDWYAEQVSAAVSKGYILGFEDNTFRPDDKVTRVQAASMLARIKNLEPDEARAGQFADGASIPGWAKGVVGAVANAGCMIGDEANNFNAGKALTRAEAVVSLDRVFNVEEKEEPVNAPVSSNEWKDAYIDYVNEHGNVQDSSGHTMDIYKLVNVNGDNIPELYINYGTTAGGDVICTYYEGKVVEQAMWNYGFSYVEGQNIFRDSGDHMDIYYDNIYSIENGKFVLLHKGSYGAADNSQVKVDSNGNPIYNYYWDDTEVASEAEYMNLLHGVYNEQQAISPFDGAEYDSEAWRYVGNGLCDYTEIAAAIKAY